MNSLSLVKYSVAANSNWLNLSLGEFSRQQMYFLKPLLHHIFLLWRYDTRSILFMSLIFTDKDFVLPLKYWPFSSCFLFFGASFFQNSLLLIFCSIAAKLFGQRSISPNEKNFLTTTATFAATSICKKYAPSSICFARFVELPCIVNRANHALFSPKSPKTLRKRHPQLGRKTRPQLLAEPRQLYYHGHA